MTIPGDASLLQAYRAITADSAPAVLVVGRTEGQPLVGRRLGVRSVGSGKDESLACARDAITERATSIDPSATPREAVVSLLQAGVTHVLVRRSDDSMPGFLFDL